MMYVCVCVIKDVCMCEIKDEADSKWNLNLRAALFLLANLVICSAFRLGSGFGLHIGEIEHRPEATSFTYLILP